MNLRSLQWRSLRPVQKFAVMRAAYKDWVASGLLKKGKSKGGLAKVLGVHQSQITRLLDGDRQIKAEELPLIARYIQEPPPAEAQFEAEEPDESGPRRMIPIIGYVGANSQAHSYQIPAGQLDEIEAPEDATESTVAVEIKGESLGALFDRWIVFYDDVREPVTPDLYGRLCVVGLPDERILIKKIKHIGGGFYDLLSNTEETIQGVAIKWAAKVKNMVPR